MSKWSEIYAKEIEKAGGEKAFFNLKVKEKRPLIREVIRHATENRRVLEAGCGTGIVSSYLAGLNLDVTAIDADEDMLKLAKMFCKFVKTHPSFRSQDLSDLDYPRDYFDVTFSHGVLEHFKDSDIVTIINRELAISRFVLASIPSDYYAEEDRMFGDERFMSAYKWRVLIAQTQGRIIREIGFYPQNSLYALVNKVAPARMIHHAPYIAFVISTPRKNP